MKILIIGASTKTSIGFSVGEKLKTSGHQVVYASRSGKLGAAFDICDPNSVADSFKCEQPNVVILAAGVFALPQKIGSITHWEKITEHLSAKTKGALIAANAAAKLKQRIILIVLGGRELSAHSGFAQFTVANGALWSLVQFLNKHTKVSAYYLDLPFVSNSTMERAFRKKFKTKQIGISATEIADCVETLLNSARAKKKRIILGAKGGA